MKPSKCNRFLSLALVLLMTLSAIPMTVFAAGSSLKVITVDKSGEYQTIQAAIDAIAEEEDPTGWTIKVQEGEYGRFTVLDGLDGLTVKAAENAVVHISVLDGTAAPSPDSAGYPDTSGISVRAANHVTIDGLTIHMGAAKKAWFAAAISTHSQSGHKGNDLTVKNCVLDGQGEGYGVFVDAGVDRFSVENCTFHHVFEAVSMMCDGTVLADGQITDNVFQDCSFAVHGYYGGTSENPGTLHITGNTIKGTSSLYSKVVLMDQCNTGAMKVRVANNSCTNALIGNVNLREAGEANDVLADNTFDANSFYVEAIEPGTIEFYSTYHAPQAGYGHWELRNPEGLDHLDIIKEAIKEANQTGAHTLSITGIPAGELIKTFTWFKDCIYWITDPEPADPVVPESPASPDWNVSKSKTATNLDQNFISDITLSLPSAEENLKTDIVFVFDESSCSAPVKAEVSAMLERLYAQEEGSGAAIQIGAVQFRGEVTEFPLTLLNSDTKDALADFMSKRPKVGGSNMSMGLLVGEKMLDEDSTVDAGRKYLILVSDGITYIWDDPATPERENIGVNFSGGDTPNHPFLAGPDGWDVRYGQKYVPTDWNEHLTEVGISLTDTITQKASAYVRGRDISGKPFVKPDEQWRYMSTVDIALFMSNQVYQRVAGKYHTFACMAGVESEMESYPYGPAFMEYLANGKEVTFDNVEKEILYLLDAGSEVRDYMGYVNGEYNFDFVEDTDRMFLTIGKERYDAVCIGTNQYGFKPVGDDWAYTLRYVPGNKPEEEHFVWTIYEPIGNFTTVQLHYSVKLMNPQAEAGVYGEYDRDGSQNKLALYTNNRATLYPVDSNHVKGEPEDFQKPTVSYMVKATDPETPEPPVPPTPTTPPTAPQTGDDSHMMRWITLGTLALWGVASIVRSERKKKNSAK